MEVRFLLSLHKLKTVWESHNDEVHVVPDGFFITASSDSCKVQGMENEEGTRFGLQFHPEVNDSEFGKEMFENLNFQPNRHSPNYRYKGYPLYRHQCEGGPFELQLSCMIRHLLFHAFQVHH